MGKQDSETPEVCVRAHMHVCVCITEYKTGNAEAASADSRGSSEISSVTLETHMQRTHKKQILDTEEGLGKLQA